MSFFFSIITSGLGPCYVLPFVEFVYVININRRIRPSVWRSVSQDLRHPRKDSPVRFSPKTSRWNELSFYLFPDSLSKSVKLMKKRFKEGIWHLNWGVWSMKPHRRERWMSNLVLRHQLSRFILPPLTQYNQTFISGLANIQKWAGRLKNCCSHIKPFNCRLEGYKWPLYQVWTQSDEKRPS